MSNNIDYDALKITKTLVVSENVYEQSFEKKCTYVRILNDIYNNKYLYIFEYVCTSEGNGRPSTIFKEQLIPIATLSYFPLLVAVISLSGYFHPLSHDLPYFTHPLYE